MQSIRTLYKVGKGPSSSHTMGPERAAKLFREMTPEADRYEVILYGSLAKTGVGHGTDRVLVDTLAPYPTKIVFASVDPGNMKHPNTLDLIAYQAFNDGRMEDCEPTDEDIWICLEKLPKVKE